MILPTLTIKTVPPRLYPSTRFIGNDQMVNFATRSLPSTMQIYDMYQQVGIAIYNQSKKITGFNIQPNTLAGMDGIALNKFAELCEQIRSKSGDLWGFICGGFEDNLDNNITAEASSRVYNGVEEILELLKIPFGMMCGKKMSVEDYDNILFNKNNIVMSGSYITKYLSGEPLTMHNLENLYDRVVIPKDMASNIIG